VQCKVHYKYTPRPAAIRRFCRHFTNRLDSDTNLDVYTLICPVNDSKRLELVGPRYAPPHANSSKLAMRGHWHNGPISAVGLLVVRLFNIRLPPSFTVSAARGRCF